MTAITDIEKQVAEALDKMGIPYQIAGSPQTDEVCDLCGLDKPDFKVDDKFYHFECEFPEGGIFR